MIPVRLKSWAELVDEKPTPCVSCGREMPAGEEVYCHQMGLYLKNTPTNLWNFGFARGKGCARPSGEN
jgi:hypothetical protein